MSIIQVPYKKFDKKNISNIMIYFLQGENTCFSISVIICFLQGENIFSIGGEHITYFLLGEYSCTQSVIIKKGRMLKLTFDDTFVKTYHWSSILQAYSRVLQDQDFPKRVAIDVYCNVL